MFKGKEKELLKNIFRKYKSLLRSYDMCLFSLEESGLSILLIDQKDIDEGKKYMGQLLFLESALGLDFSDNDRKPFLVDIYKESLSDTFRQYFWSDIADKSAWLKELAKIEKRLYQLGVGREEVEKIKDCIRIK